MKIILVQTSPYLETTKGGAKANRALMECLAALGHTCLAISFSGTSDAAAPPGAVTVFSIRGVEVHALEDSSWDRGRLKEAVARLLRQSQPDLVLTGYPELLPSSSEAKPFPYVYQAHFTEHLPFGPYRWGDSHEEHERIRGAAGIMAPSEFVADYIRRFGGIEAEKIDCLGYGSGPFPRYGSFDAGAITLVNPCELKGLSIFLRLAEARPDHPFTAVPTWGATAVDRARLAALPNMRLQPPSENIDEIFAGTRILILPSLVQETFGMLAVEAMSRGIPVLASNSGGLREAKMGVPYLLPVQPIRQYKDERDDTGLPSPIVPEQDLSPWLQALDALLHHRSHYEEVAAASHSVAGRYIDSLSGVAAERFLTSVLVRWHAVGPTSGQR